MKNPTIFNKNNKSYITEQLANKQTKHNNQTTQSITMEELQQTNKPGANQPNQTKQTHKNVGKSSNNINQHTNIKATMSPKRHHQQQQHLKQPNHSTTRTNQPPNHN